MKTLKVIAATGVVLLVAAVFISVSIYKTRRDARIVIAELKELSAPNARANDIFDKFYWKYRSRLKPSAVCTVHFCAYEFDVSNSVIAKLHLVPYTEMNTSFTIEKGQLVFALVEYRSALTGANSPFVHVQQGVCDRGCGARFDVNPHGVAQQRWNGLVEFNPRATRVEKDAALAFNLGCFSRIGGCKDLADLLPEVWQRSGPDTVTSRLVGRSQRLEESHEFPSPDDF